MRVHRFSPRLDGPSPLPKRGRRLLAIGVATAVLGFGLTGCGNSECKRLADQVSSITGQMATVEVGSARYDELTNQLEALYDQIQERDCRF